jgi:uncharacterized protein (DUF2141 family)
MQKESAERAVFIAPYPDPYPRFEWSRGDRVLSLVFEEGLIPERTYIITVGTEVRDHHSVRLDSARTFAFSTGELISTGRIRGSVWHPGSLPAVGVNLALYALIPGESPDPAHRYPTYVTQSGADGSFTAEYLPAGRYRLFAWRDSNSDGLLGDGEPLGLASQDAKVVEGGITKLPRICLALSDRTQPGLNGIRVRNASRVELQFDEPVDSVELTVASPREPYDVRCTVLENAEARPTMTAVCSGLRPEVSYGLNMRAWDSVGNVSTWDADTTRFYASGQIDTTNLHVMDFTAENSDSSAGPIEIRFWMNGLVAGFDSTGFALKEDATTLRGTWEQFGRNGATLNLAGGPDISGRTLRVPLSNLRDEQGRTCADTVEVPIPPVPEENFGDVLGSVTDIGVGPGDLRVELRSMDNLRRIVAIVGDSGTWHVPRVPAGTYRAFAWHDVDRDGAWSPGRLVPYSAAEPWAASEPVIVRPRWTAASVIVRFD